MKKSLITLFCLFLLLPAMAQQQTDYNMRGDAAMQRRDYADARLYYSSGVQACDLYSISRLTEVWKTDPDMRNGMYRLMNRCLTCLNEKAAENDTVAMAQLVIFYTDGIGIDRSENTAAYWRERLTELRRPLADTPGEETLVRKPRSIRFFAAYAFSSIMPVGLRIGGTGERFGLYAQFLTNAAFHRYTGEFSGDAPSVSEGEMLAPDVSMNNRFTVGAGITFKALPWLHGSLGAGYYQWDRIVVYNIINDAGRPTGESRNYKYLDDSYRGIRLELDATIVFKERFFVSAGIGSHFRSKPLKGGNVIADLNLGAGVFF
jgi:hypothetical protein